MKKYGNDRPNLSKSKDELSFVWVVDFPLFEKIDGGFTFSHNPFTAPYSEDLEKIKGKKDLENIKSLQVDLVCNGEEVGSGSIRITDPEIQSAVFSLMGYSKQEIQEQFGHLLNAYKYGAPIHGGIALGFDRLVSLLIGEDNIREVIAFPVTSGGQTSVMDAPSEIKKEQLKEFGIKLDSNLEISVKKDQEPEGKQ